MSMYPTLFPIRRRETALRDLCAKVPLIRNDLDDALMADWNVDIAVDAAWMPERVELRAALL